jgi:hypothetical protein
VSLSHLGKNPVSAEPEVGAIVAEKDFAGFPVSKQAVQELVPTQRASLKEPLSRPVGQDHPAPLQLGRRHLGLDFQGQTERAEACRDGRLDPDIGHEGLGIPNLDYTLMPNFLRIRGR